MHCETLVLLTFVFLIYCSLFNTFKLFLMKNALSELEPQAFEPPALEPQALEPQSP